MTVIEYDMILCDRSSISPHQVVKFFFDMWHEIRMALASHGGLLCTESLNRALNVEGKAIPAPGQWETVYLN